MDPLFEIHDLTLISDLTDLSQLYIIVVEVSNVVGNVFSTVDRFDCKAFVAT